jgi:putative endopeptidase
MLAIAEGIPDFDYDKFFRSYSKMWRTCRSLAKEKERAKDEHPLEFLRTNVTLMQFDEFIKTYDIQPGDGMYMDPAQRLSVW